MRWHGKDRSSTRIFTSQNFWPTRDSFRCENSSKSFLRIILDTLQVGELECKENVHACYRNHPRDERNTLELRARKLLTSSVVRSSRVRVDLGVSTRFRQWWFNYWDWNMRIIMRRNSNFHESTLVNDTVTNCVLTNWVLTNDDGDGDRFSFRRFRIPTQKKKRRWPTLTYWPSGFGWCDEDEVEKPVCSYSVVARVALVASISWRIETTQQLK